MKRFSIFLVLLLCCAFLSAQSFSFSMYFEDAMGNKDTLIIGYAPAATDSVDAALGEVNLISTPINKQLDVRITDEYNNREVQQVGPGTYHLQTQIVEEACNAWLSILVLDIHTSHWPVTARWNSLPFQDACRYASVFTAINPGGWWDTGSISDLERASLRIEDSVTFTSNHAGNSLNPAYSYVNDSLDTIPVFWMAFRSYIGLSFEESLPAASIHVYPNPTPDFLQVEMLDANLGIDRLQLFDLKGVAQDVFYDSERIDLRNVPDGIYFLRLRLQNGEAITCKIKKY